MKITLTWSCNRRLLCLLFAVTFIFNSAFATVHVSGNQSGTWTKAKSPYILDGSVTIASGSTLTIQAGSTVIFPSYSITLEVRGTLNAQGTAVDSIKFRGQADANYNTKYGGGINIYTSTTIMKYISIDSLGDPYNQTSIWINPYDTITPTITNTSVKHSGSLDIYSWTGGAKNFSAINGVINIISSSILGNATMPKVGGSYYNLLGSVTVDAGKTLTIQAGATIIFPSYSTTLEIRGTLNAQGTMSDSIRFKGKANSDYSTKYGGGVNIYTSTSSLNYVSTDSLGDSYNQTSIWINPYDTITPTIANTSVKHSGSLDIYTWAGGAKNFSAINGIINIFSGSAPGNATMPKIAGNNYYNLLGLITVDAGKTLTIQAGATLVFTSSSSILDIKGTLNAQGIVTDSIRFKGIASSYYGSQYGGGINLYNSTSIMKYVSMDSLGNPYNQSSIWINPYDTVAPTISNTSVKHSGNLDIYTWAGGAKNFSAINGVISIASGTLPGNATMPKISGNTYYSLLGSVSIASGITLTIQAGATVVFPSYFTILDVKGTLNAQGNASDSIKFKGTADPTNSSYKYGGGIDLYTSTSNLNYISMDSLGDPFNQSSIWINPYDTITPTIANSSIKHSGSLDIYTWAGGAKNISNLNGVINVIYGSIAGNAIMPKISGNTHYNLTGSVTVDVDKILTILPGATIYFTSYYTDLNINGKLDAQGTLTDSIRFKGKADPDNSAYKYGGYIYLNSSSTIIKYVSIDSLDDPSNGTSASIYIYPYDSLMTPVITNTSIKHSGVADIYTWAGGAKNMANINGVINIALGSIVGNATMPKINGSYYNLTGSVTVDAGKSLTIQPGATIQFPSPYTDLTINGVLNARGNSNDTIRFKGTKDVVNNTLYGGSVNLNADGSNLSFISVDSMGGYNTGAVMGSAAFAMKYVSIRNSMNDGISIYSPNANISYSNITKNATGVGIYYCKAVINNCNIYGNNTYGVNNVSLTTLTDATLNYWGTTSGPYHPALNKNGTGNKVSDSVTFRPFKTTAVLPVLPYINTFSPSAAATDTVIKITGLRFTGATKVLFGNTTAKSFTVVNDSTITAVVGAGGSGYVKITTAQGSDSLDGFIYCSGVALHADFIYTTSLFDIYLTNTSTDVTSYVWNFGDGDTTSTANPSHVYDTAGTYTICLSDTNVCAKRAETICKVVVVYGLAFIDDDKDGLNDLTEAAQYGTTTGNFDTNGDGLGDGPNVFTGLSAISLDTDNDGISNLQELINGTNPLLADTDGDGVNDKSDPFPLDRYRSKLPATNSSDHTVPTITLSEPL